MTKLTIQGQVRKLTPYSRYPAKIARFAEGYVMADDGARYPAAATYWKQGDRYWTYVKVDGKSYHFQDKGNFVTACMGFEAQTAPVDVPVAPGDSVTAPAADVPAETPVVDSVNIPAEMLAAKKTTRKSAKQEVAESLGMVAVKGVVSGETYYE